MTKKTQKKVNIPVRKEATSVTEISEYLAKTGFILEMEVAEFLKKNGFQINVNKYFFDYDENKKREIDIIAQKTINDIDLVLIVECKQSLDQDWIFVCSDKTPSRYYNYIKHFPRVTKIKETGLFDHLRFFDHKIHLAQNYTARAKDGKKSENGNKAIYDTIQKLPKIVVDKAKTSYTNKRTIFLPMAVFSSQIFIAKYNRDLLVQETASVQFGSELDSEAYTYHKTHNYYGRVVISGFSSSATKEEVKNSPVAEMSQDLGSKYLIEIVTKKGLPNFLREIERQLNNVNLELWPLKKEEKLDF